MFGKMMNNFYYGKSGKGDFRKEDLPENRWQLFGSMLRIRFSGLVRLNLIYMLCWLPTIIVLAMDFFMLLLGPDPESGMTVTDFSLGIVWQTCLLMIPCLLITGPFTAGVSYVTRNWARDEHAFVWSDFKDAVKENWKQSLVVSAITSVLPTLVYVCSSFYGQLANTNGAFFILPEVLVIVAAVMWLMALMYIYPMIVTYKMKLGAIIRNAFLLVIGRLPQTVGIKLLTLLPLVIGFVVGYCIPSTLPYVIPIEALYYILLGYSLSRFVQASYSNAVFDKYINKRIEGAEVDRGLYKDPDADDGEDDTTEDD